MLTIDKEFSELIPPLQPEEYKLLEDSIRTEGCREPIVTWNKIIVDGHNRFRICTQYNVPYKTTEREFEDRDDVKLWMMHNQLARRNLIDAQRAGIVKKCEAAIKAKSEARMKAGKADPMQKFAQGTSRDELGKLAGMSGFTYSKASDVIDETPEAISKAMLDGALSINKAYEISQLDTETQEEIAEQLEDVIKKAESLEQAKKEAAKAVKPFVTNNSGNNEWYTPADYIALARRVMGEITLDPASCELANKTVQANKFYTKEDDGLKYDWHGNVWLNPPYSTNLIGKFADKLIECLPNINNAIVLVNNATDTSWFRTLVAEASAVCFTYGRVRFNSPDKKTAAPLQGQALLYFGDNAKTFVDVFSAKGWCAYPA